MEKRRRILVEVSSTGFSVKMERPLWAASAMSGSCVGVGVEMMIPSRGVGEEALFVRKKEEEEEEEEA